MVLATPLSFRKIVANQSALSTIPTRIWEGDHASCSQPHGYKTYSNNSAKSGYASMNPRNFSARIFHVIEMPTTILCAICRPTGNTRTSVHLTIMLNTHTYTYTWTSQRSQRALWSLHHTYMYRDRLLSNATAEIPSIFPPILVCFDPFCGIELVSAQLSFPLFQKIGRIVIELVFWHMCGFLLHNSGPSKIHNNTETDGEEKMREIRTTGRCSELARPFMWTQRHFVVAI